MKNCVMPKQNLFRILFFISPVFYFLIIGRFDFNDIDSGWMTAMSWRIFNGETPYKDFIYIKPFLTPYLHTIPLYFIPHNYIVIFERFFALFLIWGASYLSTLIINKLHPLKSIHIDKFLFALTVFVFALNIRELMPWYDYDALFFYTFGIYLVFNKESLLNCFLGATFIALAALAKQSYLFIPIFIFLGAIFLKNKKQLLSVALGFIAVLLGSISILFYQETFDSFIKMYSSPPFKDFIGAAVKPFVKINVSYTLLPVAVYLILSSLNIPEGKTKYIVTIIFIIGFCFISLLASYFVKYPGDFVNSYFYVLFFLGLFIAYKERKTQFNFSIFLFMLILISWTETISWTTTLRFGFIAPLLFSFYFLISTHLNIKHLRRIYLLNIISAVLLFWGYSIINLQVLYSGYKLSEIYPKLSYLQVPQSKYNELIELKQLSTRYQPNVENLPCYPIIHFLNETQSKLLMDIDNVNETHAPQIMINDLNARIEYAILEKRLIKSNLFENSLYYMSKSVIQNWQKIDSTEYFDVYQNPNFN